MKPHENLSIEDLPGEIWKDIPGWEGCYQVSNLGRAKALKRSVSARAGKLRSIKEHILKQSIIKGRPYLGFMASIHQKKTRIYLHRIVAKLFVKNPDNKPIVDHINTITFDNRAQNLRWVTAHENASNELTKYHTSIAKSGKNCYFYGKTFNTRKVRCALPDGSSKQYNSIKEASLDGYRYKNIQYSLSKPGTACRDGSIWYYAD